MARIDTMRPGRFEEIARRAIVVEFNDEPVGILVPDMVGYWFFSSSPGFDSLERKPFPTMKAVYAALRQSGHKPTTAARP
jgi:hypothetical protein